MPMLVTGGAGFVGSHLCGHLLGQGHEVVCMDNLLTGEQANLTPMLGNPRFTYIQHDVIRPILIEPPIDAVLHLASPASPRDYAAFPLETLRVGSLGTQNALELAKDHDAVFLLASTSEVYGDPLQTPQREDYWGNVNPVGPRSMYDEAKRYAEALTMAYHRSEGVDTRIMRIFNTYGPRMRAGDGRAMPNLITQALNGQPLTIYGDGTQTRSFCYVDDLVAGIHALLVSGEHEPVNLGNPVEITILELAERVLQATGSGSSIEHHPLPGDDPKRRLPDISRARERLGWEPMVGLHEGLERTVAWFAAGAERDPLRVSAMDRAA